MSVSLRITVSAPDGQPSVLDLYRWVAATPGGGADVRLAPGAGTDDAGALGDLSVIQAVLSDVTALGGLLVAIGTWRDARSPRASARIEHGTTSVTVTGGSPEQVREMLALLAAANPASAEAEGADATVSPGSLPAPGGGAGESGAAADAAGPVETGE